MYTVFKWLCFCIKCLSSHVIIVSIINRCYLYILKLFIFNIIKYTIHAMYKQMMIVVTKWNITQIWNPPFVTFSTSAVCVLSVVVIYPRPASAMFYFICWVLFHLNTAWGDEFYKADFLLDITEHNELSVMHREFVKILNTWSSWEFNLEITTPY